MLDFTQEEVEKTLSDVLPHGIREAIAKGTGIYPKVLDAYFNPFDERKSPHFTVLHIQAVLDSLDPATGDKLWTALNVMREASRPHAANLSPDHELGQLSKEITDVIVARCEGRPVVEQAREIEEARRQLDVYEQSLWSTAKG